MNYRFYGYITGITNVSCQVRLVRTGLGHASQKYVRCDTIQLTVAFFQKYLTAALFSVTLPAQTTVSAHVDSKYWSMSVQYGQHTWPSFWQSTIGNCEKYQTQNSCIWYFQLSNRDFSFCCLFVFHFPCRALVRLNTWTTLDAQLHHQSVTLVVLVVYLNCGYFVVNKTFFKIEISILARTRTRTLQVILIHFILLSPTATRVIWNIVFIDISRPAASTAALITIMSRTPVSRSLPKSTTKNMKKDQSMIPNKTCFPACL